MESVDTSPPSRRRSHSAGATLPGNLDLADAMRILDVASALRRESETVESQFNRESMRARLREKLLETARLTGESLTPEQLDAAIDWYFDNLHTYRPPPAGLANTLAHLYIRRGRVAAGLAAVCLLALMIGWLATSAWSPFSPAGRLARQQAAAEQAAQRARQAEARAEAEARRTRLAVEAQLRQRQESLQHTAANLERHTAAIRALTAEEEPRQQAARWQAQGAIYAEGGELEPLQALAQQAAALHDRLAEEYTVSVVSGEGRRSAFERFFEDERGKRLSGHYLIVEARDPRGQILRRRIRNDESGEEEFVTQWAERVSPQVYERLRDDKTSDGILNETRFAEKRAGEQQERIVMPDAQGKPLPRGARITRW